MKLINKTILIISNEPWGDIWYSKHNWAFELSKNNKVFFVNPPKKWKFSNLFTSNVSINNYTDNLYILNYNNRLPYTRFNILFKINEFLVFKSLKKIFKNEKDIVFWTFDPYRLINPKKMNLLTSIYFIADKYQIQREKQLINNVENILSVSKELTKDIKNKPILNLSHGISESEFITEKKINDNFILYIGGIDYRLDYETIEHLLKSFPKEKFLFIGKISEIDDNSFKRIFIEKKYSNLEYKKAIHFKELKNYIYSAKICLAPMKKGVQGNSINHHKLLQYLSFGKPVLSAKFNDYKNNDLLIEYINSNEAVDKLKLLLDKEENNDVKQKRINFAKQFLYSNLINKIEMFFNEKGT